ncbi:MAG TPA: prephenate dehydratase [Anaeromyxobacter sp.]
MRAPRRRKAQRRSVRPAPRGLDELRARIDVIDARILGLLNDRARIAAEVGEHKRISAPGAPFHAPAREREVLARLEKMNEGPFPTDAIHAVFQEIMSACLSLERPLRVAFLGPEGAFSHQAVKHQFGASVQPIPQRAISAVFHAVEAGQADYGVVPVESATQGVVDPTLDAFLESKLRIVGEILLPFELSLLVHGEVDPASVAHVYAQPEALQAAEAWLEGHLAHATHVVTASAAEAARLAREDPGGAAVAPDVIAKLFDLRVAAERIQVGGDATRFWVLGEKPSQRTGRDRTSLVVSVRDSPGVLLRILEPLARRGINLTRIESRPAPRRAWEYVFFLDLDGHESDEAVAAAIRDIEQVSAGVRRLGSFPRAEAEPSR